MINIKEDYTLEPDIIEMFTEIMSCITMNEMINELGEEIEE